MSLIQPSLSDVVKKQYIYKLKAYMSVFTTLFVLHLIALVFSIQGVGSSGTGDNSIEITVKYYSADGILMFTFLWAFVTSILLTTKAYRYDDFFFVTNRLSSHLSNVFFMLTASVIAGIFAMFSGSLLKVIMHYGFGTSFVQESNVFAAPGEWFIGIAAAILYVLLFCAAGYFIGTLVQVSKAFAVVIPVVFFGTAFLEASKGEEGTIASIFRFFADESSFTLFLVKVAVTAAVLFAGSIAMFYRMEVRQ